MKHQKLDPVRRRSVAIDRAASLKGWRTRQRMKAAREALKPAGEPAEPKPSQLPGRSE